MKKIFTLTLILLATMFGANAQYLFQEGFETGTLPTGWTVVDADGDGYTWDASFLYQSSGAAHTGDGMIASASYINNLGALTPDNWLISPAVNMSAAGTLTFWVKGQDASYSAENYSVYVATSNTVAAFSATTAVLTGTTTGAWEQKTVDLSSYVGQTIYFAIRHHNTTDMYWLDLDDVEIFAHPTDPTIVAQPSTINFGTVMSGTTQTQTVNVVAYNLSSAVTATTTAPFSVSADGTTFGTTATVAAAGGTLYVKYAPTAVATDNGTVTLSSTGATNVTITLAGEAIDCNASIPYSYAFDNDAQAQCWSVVDANNDGYTFNISSENGYAEYSYNSSQNADDWLISPVFTLNDAYLASIDYYVQSSNYPEKFQVLAIGNDTVVLSNVITANSTTAQTLYFDLSSLNGNYQIAFHCISDADQWNLFLTNFNINLASASSLTVIPEDIDFGTSPVNFESVELVDITAISISDPITLSVAAPFQVSLDNTTYAATATIPASAVTVSNYMVFVKFAPTAVGTYNQNLIIATTGISDTVALTGEAIDCTTSLPYSTNFDNEGTNLCWEIDDANYDGYTFNFNTTDGYAYYPYSSSNDANDWLISPAFALTGAQFCYLDYAAQSTTYPERFQVFAIDANNNTTPLTSIIDVTSTTFQTQTIDLTSLTGNYRIGIHCISDADMYYLKITNFNVNNNVPAASATLSTDALDFSTVPMNSVTAPKTVVLSTININEAFTLSTTAPYEISIDGTNYATTQTIPANATMVVDDIIYVRFAPTAVGTFNENLTITSTSTNNTVTLTGAAADCSGSINTFPFVQDFNAGVFPPVCWGYNDAENFFGAYVDEAGTDLAMGVSDIDMLVTPEINSTSPMALMFDYRGYLGDNADIPSTFRVGYSTTNANASSFTWVETINVDSYPEDDVIFFTYSTTIPANAKYVALDFTYFAVYESWFGDYEDVIYIDNFRLITDGNIFTTPESLDFGSVIAGSTSNPKNVNVTSALLTSSISVTAPANFEVSSNGATYSSTATLPQAGGTLFVRYSPAAAGNHSGNITLTSGSTTKTITVAGSAIDCSAAQALPYFDGFEDGIGACYRNIDNDGDGYTWYDNIYSEWPYEPYEGNGCAMSASYINDVGALYPDNWLITPALAIPAQGAKVSWYVAAQDGNYPAEYYEVLVSSTPDNLNSYATIFNETLETSEWEQRTANIPSSFNGQTAYVAFRHYDVTDMFWMKIDNLSVTPGTGVENHEVNTTIYPNPANNVLNINASCNINRVEVYNMMGQLVSTFDANDMNVQINTTHFANGVYTLKIDTENGTSTQKFTVAR